MILIWRKVERCSTKVKLHLGWHHSTPFQRRPSKFTRHPAFFDLTDVTLISHIIENDLCCIKSVKSKFPKYSFFYSCVCFSSISFSSISFSSSLSTIWPCCSSVCPLSQYKVDSQHLRVDSSGKRWGEHICEAVDLLGLNFGQEIIWYWSR